MAAGCPAKVGRAKLSEYRQIFGYGENVSSQIKNDVLLDHCPIVLYNEANGYYQNSDLERNEAEGVDVLSAE